MKSANGSPYVFVACDHAEREEAADFAKRLREAGIQVLSDEQSMETPGKAYLYLNVNTYKRDESYAFCVGLELKQAVTLRRDPSISVLAVTWSGLGVVGAVGSANLRQVRESVRDELDRFINAYLAVNPKE